MVGDAIVHYVLSCVTDESSFGNSFWSRLDNESDFLQEFVGNYDFNQLMHSLFEDDSGYITENAI